MRVSKADEERVLSSMDKTKTTHRSVLKDSSMLLSAGLKQATITVVLLPPRESCNSRVKRELRYGIYSRFFASFSHKALITLPNAKSPRLILIPARIHLNKILKCMLTMMMLVCYS